MHIEDRGVRVRQFVGALLILMLAGRGVHAQPLVEAFPALSFQQPIFLTSFPDGTDRIAVAQQNGVIRVFPNDSSAAHADTLLDVSALLSSSGGEEGLLGLAFDPGYALNGFFYVNYTAPSPLRTVVKRFAVPAATPNRADPGSGFPIIEIAQPFSNHNGGMIAFGPDGYLYVGMGDGGSGGDPLNNAQDRTRLLGKILRIDIRDTTATAHYRIPTDNPFTGNSSGYREEIWAYGLRNPWRFSFDSASGQLWAGDVGQNLWEEVDLIEKGKDYGWRIMEGSHCYNPSSGCDTTGLTFPIKEYSHSLGNAITGGYIYRGSRRPDLVGAYVYGDFGSGRIWMLRYENGLLVSDSLLIQIPKAISSFGVDRHDELYVLTYSTAATNKIYRFAGSQPVSAARDVRSTLEEGFMLFQNYPNPFNPSTAISYELSAPSFVTLKVFDPLGREVETLVNAWQRAGHHVSRFDASSLSSGSYFYTFSAGGFIGSKMMVLVK